MIFQEPKVEFIELELVEEIATTSGGGGQGQIGQCGGNKNDDDCAAGTAWNY